MSARRYHAVLNRGLRSDDEEDQMTKKIKAPIKPDTRLVTSGRDPQANHGFVNPPVYHASTLLYRTAEDQVAHRARYNYGRRGTPTSEALEDALRELDGETCAGVALLSIRTGGNCGRAPCRRALRRSRADPRQRLSADAKFLQRRIQAPGCRNDLLRSPLIGADIATSSGETPVLCLRKPRLPHLRDAGHPRHRHRRPRRNPS